MKASRLIKLVCAGLVVMWMSGCAVRAPAYSVSINNVEALKRADLRQAKVGEFSVKSGAPGATSIQLRANHMSSSVGSNYADYLADAMRKELDLAKKLDPKANFEISGVLLQTDVDAAMGTGSGYMEAQFVVKQDGVVKFDKVKRGEHHWDSSFAAAVAVPAAQQNYPMVVQNLLSALYSDADFQKALK